MIRAILIIGTGALVVGAIDLAAQTRAANPMANLKTIPERTNYRRDQPLRRRHRLHDSGRTGGAEGRAFDDVRLHQRGPRSATRWCNRTSSNARPSAPPVRPLSSAMTSA